MEYTDHNDGTARMTATKPGEDLRNFNGHGRFVCNADHPWSGNEDDAPRGVVHVDAAEVGDEEDGWPGGNIVRYKCSNCGHTWKAELPQ